MPLTEIHSRLWVSILLFSAVMALWGIWRFLRKQNAGSNYLGAVAIAGLLNIVQFVIGVILLVNGTGVLSRPQVHILYGSVIVLVLPGVYIYSRGDDSRRVVLVYAIAFVFLIGIAVRSMVTGN